MENKDLKIAQKRKGLCFGGLLIAGGTLFLLFNSNVLWQVWRPVVFSWQMLIILFGIVGIFRRNYFFGAFLALVGAFFLLPVLASSFPMNFIWVEVDFIHKYWALLIVAAGVLIVLNGFFEKHHHFHHHRCKYKNDDWYEKYCKTASQIQTGGIIKRDLVFNGRDEIFLEPEFCGGSISCVFSGFTLDLRKTALPEGETVLSIESVFSGIELYIPENWNVEIRTSNILGGSSDSRLKGSEKDLTRKLIIAGECVFGGLEIR